MGLERQWDWSSKDIMCSSFSPHTGGCINICDFGQARGCKFFTWDRTTLEPRDPAGSPWGTDVWHCKAQNHAAECLLLAVSEASTRQRWIEGGGIDVILNALSNLEKGKERNFVDAKLATGRSAVEAWGDWFLWKHRRHQNRPKWRNTIGGFLKWGSPVVTMVAY